MKMCEEFVELVMFKPKKNKKGWAGCCQVHLAKSKAFVTAPLCSTSVASRLSGLSSICYFT
jgi:hypothetical protein